MARTIVDVVFSVAILIGICLHYFYIGDISIGTFYLVLIANYIGARYLLMSDLDFAIYVAALESEDE